MTKDALSDASLDALRAQYADCIPDRYRIDGVMGVGGMGIVFRALQLDLKRTVALKVIRPELTEGVARNLFRSECQLLASLSHPGVVRVYDGDAAGSSLYLAMEIIEGAALAAILSRGERPDAAGATALICALLEGLGHVHERGILHRDIKPSNIIVRATGEPVLIDFGLARQDTAPPGTASRNSVRGTPRYMAPELLHSGIHTVASELFAVGMVGFELFSDLDIHSGEPWQEDLSLSTLLSSLGTEAYYMVAKKELASANAAGAALLRALSPDPADRPCSAAEMVRSIRRINRVRSSPGNLSSRSWTTSCGDPSGETVQVPLPRPPITGASVARRRWLTPALCAALAVCVGLAWFSLASQDRIDETGLEAVVARTFKRTAAVGPLLKRFSRGDLTRAGDQFAAMAAGFAADGELLRSYLACGSAPGSLRAAAARVVCLWEDIYWRRMETAYSSSRWPPETMAQLLHQPTRPDDIAAFERSWLEFIHLLGRSATDWQVVQAVDLVKAFVNLGGMCPQLDRVVRQSLPRLRGEVPSAQSLGLQILSAWVQHAYSEKVTELELLRTFLTLERRLLEHSAAWEPAVRGHAVVELSIPVAELRARIEKQALSVMQRWDEGRPVTASERRALLEQFDGIRQAARDLRTAMEGLAYRPGGTSHEAVVLARTALIELEVLPLVRFLGREAAKLRACWRIEIDVDSGSDADRCLATVARTLDALEAQPEPGLLLPFLEDIRSTRRLSRRFCTGTNGADLYTALLMPHLERIPNRYKLIPLLGYVYWEWGGHDVASAGSINFFLPLARRWRTMPGMDAGHVDAQFGEMLESALDPLLDRLRILRAFEPDLNQVLRRSQLGEEQSETAQWERKVRRYPQDSKEIAQALDQAVLAPTGSPRIQDLRTCLEILKVVALLDLQLLRYFQQFTAIAALPPSGQALPPRILDPDTDARLGRTLDAAAAMVARTCSDNRPSDRFLSDVCQSLALLGHTLSGKNDLTRCHGRFEEQMRAFASQLPLGHSPERSRLLELIALVWHRSTRTFARDRRTGGRDSGWDTFLKELEPEFPNTVQWVRRLP